ncbi:inositol monophosphatase [Stomatohabitans albus]|uniref:inositol monophosphatase family protein n=1 Tax=Stomatohabitans albus TaxID=3110766 RepID=UPI00300CCBD2
MSTLYEDADLAARLVREAGELAASMRAEGLRDVSSKSNVADLVTEADRAAERLVVETIRTLRPDDSIVGEEGANYTGTSDRTWVIDPVDGTYNFVTGADYWCSALALRGPVPQQAPPQAHNDAVTLGAVYEPMTKRLWVGAPGQLPTTMNGNPTHLAADAPNLSKACVLTYLHVDGMANPETLAAWTRVCSAAALWRSPGSSSVDMATIAGGRHHLWLSRTPPEWDRLPGAALLMANGGITRMVEAGGTSWMLAGYDYLVEEATALLKDEA